MSQDIEITIGDLDRARQAVLRLARAAEVTRQDFADLRRDIGGEGSLGRSEADALFTLDATLGALGEEWTDFFVRAVTDHIVWASRPTGVVSERQAEWLLERVDAARTASGFAVLVSVLEEANQVPAWFKGAIRSRAASNWPGLDTLGITGIATLLHAA